MTGPAVTQVITAPDEYEVHVCWITGDTDTYTPAGAIALAGSYWLANQAFAEELIAAATEPPPECANGDGNYAEYGDLCGVCSEAEDERAEQDERTRRGQ